MSVREVLDLLNGPFRTFADGIAEDRYAFWLGSGVSLARVDGLAAVVARVVEFLRAGISSGDQDCRFRKGVDQALALADFSEDERRQVDTDQPFSEWPERDTIVTRLVRNYARLLDVQVDNEPDDYLLWEAVDVPATFADPSIEPDVEHFCIGILVLEGVASDIPSANWDPLVERAVHALAGGEPALATCVKPEDLREPRLRARLYKFHGCAQKASEDSGSYRPLLVARQSQINGWVTRPENQAMLNRLIDIIATKPTLMLGLSVQDANIQNIFASAEARLAWPWPGERPSYVFSEDALGVDQQGLLMNVYRAAYNPGTRQGIHDGSLIRAYAKPLLVALVLHVIFAKVTKMIELTDSLDEACRNQLKDAVIALRNQIAAAAEPDRLSFVRSLIENTSRAIAMFRDGKVVVPDARYYPVTSMPANQWDQELEASSRREMAVAASIIATVADQGQWGLETVPLGDPQAGAFRLRSSAGTARVFIAANSYIALCLEQNGHLPEGDESVLVVGRDLVPDAQRSPLRAPGRTGQRGCPGRC